MIRPAVCVTTLRDRSAVSNRDRRGGFMHRDRWSRPVIAAATEVHRILGPGLPETVYKVALAEELRRRSIPFERDKTVPIRYRDLVLVTGLHLDLVVGGELIVDAISVGRVTQWHRARLVTHVKLSGCPLGLLINFNVPVLKRGVRRLKPPPA